MFRVSSLHRTRSSSPGNWPPGRPHLASRAVRQAAAAAAAASGRFSMERARARRPASRLAAPRPIGRRPAPPAPPRYSTLRLAASKPPDMLFAVTAMGGARSAGWAVLVLGLVLWLGAGVGAQWGRPSAPRGDARCSAPDGRAGTCVHVERCPEVYALLQGALNYEKIMLLDRLRCGFDGRLPLVCCAGGAPSPPQPPPPPPPPRPQPTAPPARPPGGGGGPPGPRPQDVSRHPNLRILPQAYCGPTSTDRIVGGNASDLYAYPWIARLGYRRNNAQPGARLSYNCAGTLIAERYVLTAAHCVVRRTSQVVSVRLGEYNTATPIDCKELQFQPQRQACLPPPIDVDVQHIVTHPDYNRATSYHDIALLQLAWPVDFVREEFVRPVCLPAAADLQNFALDGKKLVAAGWGTADLKTGQGSEVLLDVVVPAVGLQQCQEAYRRIKTSRVLMPQQLCAGGEKGRDSCTGDSGGPLMREALVAGEAKTVQFGVVSFGPRSCGTAGVPGVYTRVGHYMQWILDTMRP
ncbi:hypothetical protein R5R35_012276 [Gryllus longicercus]|uniref:CLIP domain-containing serine protease n=1 Tax=Gryllus longicercus TaxID=2509291 RepID=A0AAN9VWV6_9ORTH